MAREIGHARDKMSYQDGTASTRQLPQEHRRGDVQQASTMHPLQTLDKMPSQEIITLTSYGSHANFFGEYQLEV